MPRVFDRILDKVVFAQAYDWFASVLHEAQSLISQIKDPQLNYILAQAYLGASGPLKAALLIDLAKAFERVNLDWLQLLLIRYRAPKWLIQYVLWTTSSRVTIPKITNKLAPPIIPTVGLDMGRACSVLLFCLAIDPLVRQLNRLKLPVLRAYMDDTR